MKLYDSAKVIRSKNAGPLTLTLDLIFDNETGFDNVINSLNFTVEKIAALYNSDAGQVKIHPFRRVLAIKVTLPRSVSSGAPGDLDVYGCQQHFPLADIDIQGEPSEY
jgi:Domain of unknown function (DUF4387)